jgi:hypothetical protein
MPYQKAASTATCLSFVNESYLAIKQLHKKKTTQKHVNQWKPVVKKKTRTINSTQKCQNGEYYIS